MDLSSYSCAGQKMTQVSLHWSPGGVAFSCGGFRFCSVQSLSHVRPFTTPWTAACQASLSITNSQSWPKLMSIELVMPSNHLILCCPLLLPSSIFPNIRVFSKSQFFASRGQSIRVSASASVLPMNTQDWSPLGWTGWISLQSKGLSRVFSLEETLLCWPLASRGLRHSLAPGSSSPF